MDRDPQKGIGNLETFNLCTADTKPGFGVHFCWQDEKGTWPVHSKRLRTPGEGHLEKATFWRSWQTSLVVCLPVLGMAIPKSLYKLFSMVVRSSAWKNEMSALAAKPLSSSAPRLFLLPVKLTACQLIRGWLPRAPSFLYTCLALPWPPQQK